MKNNVLKPLLATLLAFMSFAGICYSGVIPNITGKVEATGNQYWSNVQITYTNTGTQKINMNAVSLAFSTTIDAIGNPWLTFPNDLSWCNPSFSKVDNLGSITYMYKLNYQNSWDNPYLNPGKTIVINFGLSMAPQDVLKKIDPTPVAINGTEVTAYDVSLETITNDSLAPVNGQFNAIGGKAPYKYVLNSIPAQGSVINNNNGTFSYTATAKKYGTFSFQYYAIDANNEKSNLATISVTVQEPPPPATITAYDMSYTTNQGESISNSFEIIGGKAPYKYTLQTSPVAGTVKINNTNSTFTYNPDTSSTGMVYFTYYATDVNGVKSNIATITISITPAPIINPLTAANLSIDLKINATNSIDLVNLGYISGGVAPYNIVLTNPSINIGSGSVNGNIFTFNSNSNTGTESITYKVTDSEQPAVLAQGTINITVTSTPTPPESSKIRGGYWENWCGPVKVNSKSASIAENISQYNVVYYAFLTLDEHPNPDSPHVSTWDGRAIYESYAQVPIQVEWKNADQSLGWAKSRIVALSKACHESGKKFIWAIGGWSDLTQTISPSQINNFVNQCVELLKLKNTDGTYVADGIDFDWEHLSENPSLRAEQLNTLANVFINLRSALDNNGLSKMDIVYTTRFNAFSTYGFDTDNEGTVLNNNVKTITNNNYSLSDLVNWSNIMNYDTPISVSHGNLEQYKSILKSFESAFKPDKIVMGFEPAYQAADGAWEGAALDKKVIDYMGEYGYGGIMFWAANGQNPTIDQAVESYNLAKYATKWF